MRQSICILIGIIVLLSLIGVIFFVAKEDVNYTEDHSREDDTNFTPFCDQNEPDWRKMISSAMTTLDYFQSNLSQTVTDVAVGTRIMEAQLNILLKSGSTLDPTVIQDLEALQAKSKLVGDNILRYWVDAIREPGLDDYMKSRYNTNLHWIRSASTWETPAIKKWTTLKCNTTIQQTDDVSLDVDFGDLSDGCIFGTFENCTIPEYCIDFFWKETQSGYKLTHQILFHYMIIQNNCFSGENRILYESQNLTDPKKFLEPLCRRVMTEALLLESRDYPQPAQDLFVEQTMVCTLAGYNDFLALNWTNVILDWAADDGTLGCYTTGPKEVPKRSARVKRWDNSFTLGNVNCSVHMGALMLGVIGQQLRYFLEMC